MNNEDEVQKVFKGELDTAEWAIPRLVKVFIASTRNDFLEERRCILENVGPDLQNLYDSTGLEVEFVDMHYGSELDPMKNPFLFAEHLDEIKNCRKVSRGCFFLCLVGDEHQPCPAPVCIAEDAYEQLKDAAQELNLEWSAVEDAYQLDPLNNHYTLPKPNEKDQEQLALWYEKNEKALVVMQEASQELLSRGLIVDPQIFHSAVQHQTLHALDLDKDHMVVFNREFTGRHNYESGIDETVSSFKHFLKDTVSPDNLIELSVEWKPGGIDGEHPEHDMYLTIFQEAVMSKMQSMINTSIEQRPELNARNKTIQEVLKEAIVHIAHCKDLIKLNPPNPQLDAVTKIRKMMSTNTKHGPIIIHGGLGSGKTSIITTIYRECEKWFDKKPVRIVRFSGVTPRASYNLELLRIICEQLTCILQPTGLCVPLDASFDPLYISDWFQTLLKRFEEECRSSTLILFIDDLHRLNPLDSDVVAGLSWLPTVLPYNVHIVCTTLNIPDELKMTPLQKERFRNSEFYLEQPNADIETIKTNINNMLDNYEKVFGLKAVSKLASYISVSEFGLTETELLELLMPTTGDFGTPLKLKDGNFNFSTFCTAKKTIMPLLYEKFMSGRILLCWRHKITFDVVMQRYLTSKLQKRTLHMEIGNLFFSEFSKDESESKTDGSVSKDGETVIQNDMTYSLRHVEESWIHLLKAGDHIRLKELTLCNFDFLLAAVRTISVSYLRSILEHARCYVLDRDVELVYYTVRKSSDVLTRDTLQLGAQIISWLRPVADSSKLMHRIIRCSVSWCDGFTDPLLVPHTSWLQPPLPLHIKCVNCGIPIRHIAPTPSAQHVVVIPKEGDAQLWHTMGNTRVQTFQGHQKPIKCLNVNKNPQLLVTGSEDRSVLVWDLNTYALLAKYTELESLVLSLCVATINDGGNKELGVVLGCENSKILLFTLKGKMVRKIDYHKGPVTAVQLTSQDVLVTGSSDCTVCLWEMDTLDLLNTISLPGPVEMLDISVDSMFLLVLCEGNQLWLHALATGTLIHNLKGYCSKVMSIALAEDCQRAVVAGIDSRVYIYDIHSGDLDLVPISTAPHHKEVIAVKITNNDDFLVTAGNGKIAYWNFRKMGSAHTINKQSSPLSRKPHTSAITCLDISRDGTMAVTGGLDSLVNVWHLNVESLENVYQLNNNELHSTMHGHTAAITCLAIASNGLFAVSGSEDKLVLVWGLTVGNAVFTFSGHQSAITAVEVTSDSEKVVSSDKAGVIAVWLSDNGTLLNSVICPATNLSVTNNMKYLVSGDGHFSLHIWPLSIKNEGGPWTEKWPVSHTEEITCFVITYDSLQIITGSKDMSLKVWQINGGKLSQVLVGHEDQVTCVAVAISDKSIVVSGSWDANLIIWDIHTGDDRHLLTGHLGHVTCVKLSGDGSVALSGSDDKRIIVWDTKRGVALTSLQLHLPILGLSMSTDVTRVAVHLYESQYLPITQLMNTPAQYVKVPVFINREHRSLAAKKPTRRMLIKEYSLDSYTWQRKYAHLTSSITRAAVDEKLRRFSVSASMEEISKQANNNENMGSQNLGPEQAALAQSQHFDQLIAEWNNKRSPSKSTSRPNVELEKLNKDEIESVQIEEKNLTQYNQETFLNNGFSYDEIPPDCWDQNQVKYFTAEYNWLYIHNKKLGCKICKKANLNLIKIQGMHVSKEWCDGNITAVGDDTSKQQTSLRKKISKHKSTQVHLKIEQMVDQSMLEVIPNHLQNLSTIDNALTEKIFRTAYFIAKNQRPYSDMPKLVDLHINNGLEMGRILQTDKACSNIIDHISSEMRKKICKDIVDNGRKLCIIVDESTTISNKTMLVICLRAAIAHEEDIITFFFDIIELQNTSASTIYASIINDLSKYGINHEYLKKNLVGFVSDGASNMLGRVSGVGVKLQNVYPNIILWHCCNHRLELAVSDTLKEVHGTNHFQSFIEKLYVLYHQSPKNRNELSICAASLEQKLLNIGKIFTIRWVASSEKTLKAVFNNYTSLYKHFFNASNDSLRESKEKAKYTGLKKILASVEFVNNLGIMYDALSELADLSLQLQNRNISLSVANNYIERAIRVFDSMSEQYGPKTEEVVDACSKLMFKDVPLTNNHSVPKINSGQFFKSLANNMRSRLFTFQASHSTTAGNVFKEKYDELLKDLDVLNVQNWPDKYDIQYGDKNVRRLAIKFQVDETSTIRGFREFKDTKKLSLIHSLRPLIVAINTIAISSSECERSFSTMNNTVTWKRNALTPNHISSLLLIQCVGPPSNSFVPISYVKSWILKGKRDAAENCCPKRLKLEDKKDTSYDNLWNYLNK